MPTVYGCVGHTSGDQLCFTKIPFLCLRTLSQNQASVGPAIKMGNLISEKNVWRLYSLVSEHAHHAVKSNTVCS